MADVCVIGAGATGLACAHALARSGRDVVCLEAAERAGGVVQSRREEGFLFEDGPNTIQASARTFRALCGELGIADDLIVSNAAAKTRYLFLHGALHALPKSPAELPRTKVLSARAKLRVMSEPLRKHRAPDPAAEEPTLGAFLEARLGKEAARTLGGAFVRGVYAAELDELGARSAFPRLWEMANEHGGLVRGLFAGRRGDAAEPAPGPETKRSDLFSFPEGLSTLTDALARELGPRLRTNTPVQDIERGPGGWSVQLERGEPVTARAVVLTVPAPQAHRMLSMAAPERTRLGALRDIGHASVAIVHLGLAGPELPPGFGFLVPPTEAGHPRAPRVLGTLFTSRLFAGRAPAGHGSVTSIYRGEHVQDLDERALEAQALEDLGRALGPDTEHRVVRAAVRRWREVIPRYSVGHARRMQDLELSIRRALPGLHLAGSYVGGVSVEDRLAYGRKLAADLAQQGGTA